MNNTLPPVPVIDPYLEKQRSHLIEATLVRYLKHSKESTFEKILEHLFSNIKSFKPEVEDIK